MGKWDNDKQSIFPQVLRLKKYIKGAYDSNFMPRQRYAQAHWWLLTIPENDWEIPSGEENLGDGVTYIRGQLERGKPWLAPHRDVVQVDGLGDETGYTHWQIVVHFAKKLRLSGVKQRFGERAHAEPTRSEAAIDYVWKDDTRIGEPFEFGRRPIRRGVSTDWSLVRDNARAGLFDRIPADVYVRYYNNLSRIATDHLRPDPIERTVTVFWGLTGTGKSRRAWEEAGFDAYPKDPLTKFWCGYQGQDHIVIDEFRGGINVAHVLRWFDRYPCVVEIKGGAVVLKARKIWITSNVDPRRWYPDIDAETIDALIRRLTIVHFGEALLGVRNAQ